MNTITHAVGVMEASHNPIDIVNDAGEYITMCHPWEHRGRPTINFTFLAGREWTELPPGVEQILEVQPVNADLLRMRLTDIEEVDRRRQNLATTAYGYDVALVMKPQDGDDEHIEHYGLSIAPALAEDLPCRLTYVEGWRPLVKVTDVPYIPRKFERALLLACRAFARNVEDEDADPAEDKPLQKELAKLIEDDGEMQTDLGPMRGGVAAEYYAGQPVWQ